MILTWLGHSCVSIETSDGVKILIDPFITGNPSCPVTVDDVSTDYIVLTHGHNDHVGDALALSLKHNAPIIANVEIADYFKAKGAETIGMNAGGKVSGPFGTIKLTPAIHSSSYNDNGVNIPMGIACGVIIDDGSTRVYHAGDTALFSDMKLVGKVDIAFLPIGDHYTMGIEDAVKAAALIDAETFIPVHYNTFGSLTQNPYHFINQLQDANGFVPDTGAPFNESCVYL